MRKDVIPVEDAQGGPRSPRRFLRLLALLLAAFALLSAVWYFTAYRPYDVYMEALRAQPGWREAPALPGCGTDGEGYNCNVARPGFLHWTGNLGIGMPNLTLENGEESIYATDEQTSADGSTSVSHVIVSDEGLIETTQTPQVLGVAVVCEGGDIAAVQNRISTLVEVLTGVGANHVTVAKMAASK